MRHAIPLLWLLASFTALGAERGPQAQEDNAREVLFNYLIHQESGAQQRPKVYFLSLGTIWTNRTITRIDPTDEFMRRFEGRVPPVRKVSLCVDDYRKVADKNTGQRGIIFTVADFKWLSKTEIEAVGNVYKAQLNGYWNTYTLTNDGRKWKVAHTKMGGVS